MLYTGFITMANKNKFSRSVFQTASEMYVESADDSLDEITSESGNSYNVDSL